MEILHTFANAQINFCLWDLKYFRIPTCRLRTNLWTSSEPQSNFANLNPRAFQNNLRTPYLTRNREREVDISKCNFLLIFLQNRSSNPSALLPSRKEPSIKLGLHNWFIQSVHYFMSVFEPSWMSSNYLTQFESTFIFSPWIILNI